VLIAVYKEWYQLIHNVVSTVHHPAPHSFIHSEKRGKAQTPSHAAHHVPRTPTTIPDEDITSQMQALSYHSPIKPAFPVTTQ